MDGALEATAINLEISLWFVAGEGPDKDDVIGTRTARIPRAAGNSDVAGADLRERFEGCLDFCGGCVKEKA